MALLTFFHHADCHALLEATELAAVPAAFVDRTVLVAQTHVLGVLLHGSLEETFAA